MSDNSRGYEFGRRHYKKLIPVEPGRRCNICKKRIKNCPEDYNTGYIRFCMRCRVTKVRDVCAPETGKLYL